jgi:hypothetical protein
MSCLFTIKGTGWTFPGHTSSIDFQTQLTYYWNMSDFLQDDHLIVSISGFGSKRTKPFTVPEGTDYFTIKWSMTGEDGLIDLYSFEDPTSSIETLSGFGPSETQWYEQGKFFFAVNTVANWEIQVVIEADAWTEYEDELTDVSSDDQITEDAAIENRPIATSSLDGWYTISANYPEHVFDSMRENANFNWVNDLSRGFLFSEGGIGRWPINQKEIAKITEFVLDIDQSFRLVVPDTQDNYPNSPTLVSPIDEKRYIREMQSVNKSFMRLSDLLRKSGAPGQYWFASGVNRVQAFKVSADTSIERRHENRVAANEQWNAMMAPQRAASAFFDEANRRGY